MKRTLLTLSLLLWTGLAAAMDRPVYSTGLDQTAQLQKVYDGASTGDTIKLVPQSGQPFVVSGTLAWTNSTARVVNVEASGATINLGPGAVLQYGGMLSGGTTAGQRGYGNWHGGSIYGNVQLINWCYSRWDCNVVGTLSIVADNAAMYNTLSGNIGTTDGSGPAVLVNLLNDGACANVQNFQDCQFRPGTAGTIVAANKSAHWMLSTWRFRSCQFECGVASKLVNVGNAHMLFADCYFEGPWSLGDSGTASRFVFRSPGGGGYATWSLDPRAIFEGVAYQ